MTPWIDPVHTELERLPREDLLAGLAWLAASLTDEALRGVVVAAMAAPKRSTGGVEAIMGRWPGDESDEEVTAALEALS